MDEVVLGGVVATVFATGLLAPAVVDNDAVFDG